MSESITPTASLSLEIHEPRLFVPDACLERCNKLAAKAGYAALKAIDKPDFQNDIVCLKKGTIACNAEVHCTGQYAGFGEMINGSDEAFLASPVIYLGGGSPVQKIEEALASGITPHSISEIVKK